MGAVGAMRSSNDARPRWRYRRRTYAQRRGGPGADAVGILSEASVPGVIDGKKQLCGERSKHAAEYKMWLRACKPSEPRGGDARPTRALRSAGINGVNIL